MDIHERNEVISKLYEEFHDPLLLRAKRYIGYHHELLTMAEDSVQDTFLKFVQYYPRLSDHPDFLGWLVKTNINRLNNMLYGNVLHKKYCAYSLDDVRNINVLADPVDTFSHMEIESECNEYIAKIYAFLLKDEKELFNRFFIEGRSLEDIADDENTTPGAVKSKIYRLRAKIKKYFTIPMSIFMILTLFFHFRITL